MSSVIKKDRLTPKERMKAFRAGKPLDRVPCNLQVAEHGAKLIGAKPLECYYSVEKFVEAQVASYREFEIQGTGSGPGLHGIAHAAGCKVAVPENSSPYIEEHAVKDYADLDRLDIPDPNKSGRLPFHIEAVKRLKEELGDVLPINIGLPGPFTTAANLRGTEQFMRDLYQYPEFAHRLLRFSVDSTVRFVEEAADIGEIGFSIADPTASGSLISLKQFSEFAFPYLKELIDVIRSVGADAPSLHICGNTKKLWGAMTDAGAGALSLDDKMDLAEAKLAVGFRVALTGNVKPTETMYLGTPEDVEENAKECLRKAYDNPKGYILSLGCGLPRGTPIENIRALLNSARKYGQYPLDPDHFSS